MSYNIRELVETVNSILTADKLTEVVNNVIKDMREGRIPDSAVLVPMAGYTLGMAKMEFPNWYSTREIVEHIVAISTGRALRHLISQRVPGGVESISVPDFHTICMSTGAVEEEVVMWSRSPHR